LPCQGVAQDTSLLEQPIGAYFTPVVIEQLAYIIERHSGSVTVCSDHPEAIDPLQIFKDGGVDFMCRVADTIPKAIVMKKSVAFIFQTEYMSVLNQAFQFFLCVFF
jgi:hypothetical protein